MAKLKIALYWAASCGGCEIAQLQIGDKILKLVEAADIVFWPVALDVKYKDVEAMPNQSIDACLFNGAIRNSEQELRADKRAGYAQVLDWGITIEFVGQVAVTHHGIQPLEAVSNARQRLPGVVGIAGSCVEVTRGIPLVREIPLPRDPHDAIPVAAAIGYAALGQDIATRRQQRPDVQIELRLEPQIARSSK